MKIGIVVDNWKLPIFEKLLNEASFEYQTSLKLTKKTAVISVETDDVKKLHSVVKKAMQKADNQKLN